MCPVPTQSAIAIIGNKLKIDQVDWNLCTHLMALDSKFLSYNGKFLLFNDFSTFIEKKYEFSSFFKT